MAMKLERNYRHNFFLGFSCSFVKDDQDLEKISKETHNKKGKETCGNQKEAEAEY